MPNYYTLASVTLPIVIAKGSDKKDPVYLVLNTQYPDTACINSNGKFDPDQAFPLLDENGQFCFHDDPKLAQYVTKIEKELTEGQYSYLTLVNKGFLTKASEIAIATAIVDHEFRSRELTCDLDSEDKRQLLRRLTTVRMQSKIATLELGGVDTILKNLNAITPSENNS